MRSASARARLFGQYVYQELALVIASSTVVTTFGFGAAGMVSSAAETHAPSNSPSRRPWHRIAVTTPPSWQRARISGSVQRAATTRR